MPTLPTTRQFPPAILETGAVSSSDEFLARAFSTFTQAAESLENSYRSLQAEVAQMRQELADANRDLAISLDDNQRMRLYLERILESLPCGVIVASAQGKLLRANPEARRLLELPPAASGSACAPPPTDLTLPFDENLLTQAARDSEWEFTRSGSARILGIRRTALTTGPGAPSGEAAHSKMDRIYILRDLTEEKHLQRERESARRLQSLAEVATVLAHEIRNPLASLELFAGLISDTAEAGSRQRQWIDHIRAGLRVLSGTVNNVLQMHSQASPQFMPVGVVRLLSETFEFLRPLSQEWQAHIQFDRPAREITIQGEPHRLQQVFLNLALNAFHAMTPGKTLRVSAKDFADTGESPVFVRIEFQDQGSGIAPEHLTRIFEPGFSTRTDSPGIGLAVSKKIIEQHGGSIRVSSAAGRGSSFVIQLPVPEMPEMAAGTVAHCRAADRGGRWK